MKILLEKLRHRLLNNEFIKFYNILAAILDLAAILNYEIKYNIRFELFELGNITNAEKIIIIGGITAENGWP